MTIMEDTFMLIREEHPDLDAEIRGILMARAQTGATIGQIKEDYRKATGITFPVFDKVTDFLLCIPGVMAFCNEHGTRIFNVRPTQKTQHIYNMIVNQKPSMERASITSEYKFNNNRFQNRPSTSTRDGNFQWHRPNLPPPTSWRNQSFRPTTHQGYADLQAQQAFFEQQHRSHRLSQNVENSNGISKKRKGSYHDNCEYLFNRIYNGSDQNSESNGFESNENNFTNNFQNIEPNNEIIEIAEDSVDDRRGSSVFTNPAAPLENEIFKRPTGRAVRTLRTLTKDQHELNNNFDPNGINFFADDGTMGVAEKDADNESDRASTIMNPPLPIENDAFKHPTEYSIRARNMHTSSPSGTRSSQTIDSGFSYDTVCEARLLDFPLLGDDFFLYLARMELRCKFKRFERVLQSGLCVSGQTIRAAIRRVARLPYNNYPNRRMIVNIGSVDIMQGKPLVQIEHDYRNLINAINRRGLQPILTTLAPLANYAHNSAIKSTIERFNDFIKREGRCLLVIDIWALFVNEKKQTFFDCYQNEPRQVTGANESYVFWNKIGRQRVLQLIESKLEY